MWLRLVAWTFAATLPSTDRLPGLDRVDARPFLRQLRREAPLAIRAVLVIASLVFLVTPVFTVGWPVPAFLLPRDRLDRHAQALAGSRIYLIRQSMLMLKSIAGLCWGADPEVRRQLGLPAYPPDPGTWRAA